MGEPYLLLKLAHVFVAIVALGTSAGLGIVLEFYGSDRVHGAFVLRAVQRITLLVVLPGYLLMLGTGLWMAELAWPFAARWLQAAVGLWILGVLVLGGSCAAIRNQRKLHATEGVDSARYRHASILGRISGGSFGLVVVAILYLMVFKP